MKIFYFLDIEKTVLFKLKNNLFNQKIISFLDN